MLLSTTLGQKVVNKSDAETLGSVDGVVIDAPGRTISALRLGKGRKAKLIPWDALSGVGSAAVIVERDGAVRDPAEGNEQRFANGDVTVIGAGLLSDSGNSQGTISDIDYDERTGALTTIHTSLSMQVPAERLLAAGTYAWIVTEHVQP